MKELPEAVRAFIAEAPVCRIATVKPDGVPHIIPVCPVFDGVGTLYVDLGKRGVSARAIEGNRSVTVLIDEYNDDWSKLRAVVLYCEADELSDQEVEAAWDVFRAKFPQGAAIGWSARHTLGLRVRDSRSRPGSW